MKGTGTPMRRGHRAIAPLFLVGVAAFAGFALPACGSGDDDPNSGKTASSSGAPTATTPAPTATTTPAEQVKKLLDARTTDYGEALRTASLKLRDRVPDLSEIKQIDGAANDAAKKVAYEALIDTMLTSPEFSQSMIKFFKDTFRTAQTQGADQNGKLPNNVNMDGAPTFAAELVIEGRKYSELFTATDNTCPTYDPKTNTFTPTPCALPDGATAGPTTGVLTDPGILGQYFANMAFRRVRFIQETFVCSKFPAEFSPNPVVMGNGSYTGLMPFTSISGKVSNPTARVDFQDTKATICANCHVNINHIAPAFINFDVTGALKDTAQVKVPIAGEPAAQRTDYLPAGEPLAWRSGKTFTDIPSLGGLIAADPAVAACAVNRIWNYALSRGDIVNDLAPVPAEVTQPYIDKFNTGGMNLKETIRDVFKSEDFTKF